MPEPTEVTTGRVATWLNVHEGTEDALLLADSDGECGLLTIRGCEVDIAPGSRFLCWASTQDTAMVHRMPAC